MKPKKRKKTIPTLKPMFAETPIISNNNAIDRAINKLAETYFSLGYDAHRMGFTKKQALKLMRKP